MASEILWTVGGFILGIIVGNPQIRQGFMNLFPKQPHQPSQLYNQPKGGNA